MDNGAGRITAEYAPAAEGFCDGQWHSVTANKLRHRLELLVDGKLNQAQSPNPRSNACNTNDPIYVGGYPGTAAGVVLIFKDVCAPDSPVDSVAGVELHQEPLNTLSAASFFQN